MSAARAIRRRETRGHIKGPGVLRPVGSHGGVIGRLDDGRHWTVLFPSDEEARRFLILLGPPPASEARLQAALYAMGKGAIRHV